MKKIRIAQIGTGHDHAGDSITVLKNKSDQFELCGAAIVAEDNNNCFAFTYEGKKECYKDVPLRSVEDILADPTLDAVAIEAEDRALTKYAQMAADRGLHIHMDKPGGISGADYNKLVDTVKEKQLVFQTGYMYRYNLAIENLLRQIENGELGEILSVEAQMNLIHNAEKRTWLGDYPGGEMFFLGCHMVDLIYRIQGAPQNIIPLNRATHMENTTSQDFGMAVFEYPNGVSFAKSSAAEHGGYDRRQLVVCGTRGTVEIRPLEKGAPDRTDLFVPLVSEVREVIDGNCRTYTTEPRGRYDAMFDAFAAYIRKESKNPYDYEYERNLHEILLRACGA